MNTDKIQSIQAIADKHVLRILNSIKDLQKTNSLPFTEKIVKNFSDVQILYTEMLTSRFAKLQDHLGANVFDLFFTIEQENFDDFTMIDKLNKLEKLGIIPDAHIWREMRKVRNIVEHEYPDNPALIAKTLNEIIELCPILLAITTKLFTRINNDL